MLLGDERLPANFWSRVQVDEDSECWLWTGAKTVAGYGHFGRKYRQYNTGEYVHRITVSMREDLVSGLVVDHLCRNRACCNPAHLEQVTIAENLRRGEGSERYRKVCSNDHERTKDNTAHRRGDLTVCLDCERARSRRYAEKKRAAS